MPGSAGGGTAAEVELSVGSVDDIVIRSGSFYASVSDARNNVKYADGDVEDDEHGIYNYIYLHMGGSAGKADGPGSM